METYRLNVARLTFKEELCLLPHGMRGYFSRRFGAARQAGGRFPLLLLPGPAPLAPAEAGRELPEKFARIVAQARQLGFKESQEFLVDHPLASGPRPMVLMRHASGNACLRLYAPAPGRPPGELTSATFLTPLVDRTFVMSSSERRATVLLPPEIVASAYPELSPRHDPLPLRQLWEEHKRAVAEQPVAAPAPLASADEVVALYESLERRIFAWRESSRDLLIPLNEQEKALLQREMENARREQRRLRRGGVESALTFASLRAAFAPPSGSSALPDAPLDPATIAAAPSHGFARAVYRPLRQGGWLDAFLAATVLLVVFGMARNGPPPAWHDPVLWLAVLSASLLHGLGHSLGWRRVRHKEAARPSMATRGAARRRRPLFRHLPSAAEPSDKGESARMAGGDLSWARATAILLGPIPGLLLGTALLSTAIYSPLPQWLALCGGVLLGLNFLTLLPLPFFDGGRLLRLLLFGRLPWLAPVVRACLVAVLGACSLALQSLSLGMVALLLAATLPYHCRMAAVGRAALYCFGKAERRLLLRRGGVSLIALAGPIVTIVRRVRARLPHLVTPERVSRVAHRLCETVLLRPRSWRPPVVGLAIYGVALLLPLLPALCYLFQGRQMAELALIGGTYQHVREPIAAPYGMPIYIGMEEEAIVEEANGTRTPFPEGSPTPGETPLGNEGRGPKLSPEELWLEETFPSWN